MRILFHALRQEPLSQVWRNFRRFLYRRIPSTPLNWQKPKVKRPDLYAQYQARERNPLFLPPPSLAEDEWVFMFTPETQLAQSAQAEVAHFLAEHPTADILYCDQDMMDEQGRRSQPYFKPGWSPETLLSYNYIGQPLVVRRKVWEELGGAAASENAKGGFWDFWLRVTETSYEVFHLPKVLLHFKKRPVQLEGERTFLQAYLHRQKLPAEAVPTTYLASPDDPIFHLQWPDTGPLVSILIPSKNNWKLLRHCILSLQKTSYKAYEIIVLDNASDHPKTVSYLEEVAQQGHVQVVSIPNKGDTFSYAYLNNEGVKAAEGDLLVLLNDDTEVVSPEWLSQMVGYHRIGGVGMVGAKLLYPNKRIQHVGVALNMYTGEFEGFPLHYLAHRKEDDPHLVPFTQVSRNVAATTAACCLISKQLFMDVGEFDEANFPISLNDIDLCLRVRRAGYRIVVASQAELIHKEGKSRKGLSELTEMVAFRKKYSKEIDPYYSTNYSRIRPFQISPVPKLPKPRLSLRAFKVNFIENADETCLSWQQLKNALRKEEHWEVGRLDGKPDLWIGKGYAALPTFAKAKAKSIPFIWYLDDVPDTSIIPWLEAAYCVIVPSHRMRVYVEQFTSKAPMEVIKMAIAEKDTQAFFTEVSKLDARRSLGIAANEYVCLYHAKDNEDRDVPKVLEAMGKKHNSSFRLLTVADSGDHLAYSAADIYVNGVRHSTDMSGILQAMAFGLPIISYADIGVGEYVAEGQNAALVPTGSITALCKALKRFMTHADKRAHAKNVSPQVATLNLSFGEMIDRFQGVMLGAVRTGSD